VWPDVMWLCVVWPDVVWPDVMWLCMVWPDVMWLCAPFWAHDCEIVNLLLFLRLSTRDSVLVWYKVSGSAAVGFGHVLGLLGGCDALLLAITCYYLLHSCPRPQSKKPGKTRFF